MRKPRAKASAPSPIRTTSALCCGLRSSSSPARNSSPSADLSRLSSFMDWILRTLLSCFCLTALLSAQGVPSKETGDFAPKVDHHQHLFSPELAKLISPPPPEKPIQPITAADLIRLLDQAGIQRAVVLSTAYIWSQPSRNVPQDAQKVRAENDWTSQQVAQFPKRLVGFCSVDPLKHYALDELKRCSKDPHLRTGLKLHLANSAVDYHNAAHIEKLQQVFRAANGYGMAIVVHMRPSIHLKMAYGAAEARIFLEKLLPAAPSVPIQIAHLCGTASFSQDPPVDAALGVFIDAIEKKDPRTKHLWFDVATVADADATSEQARYLAKRIREIGVKRVLYGSDAAIPPNFPKAGWATFRKLPLTEDEFRT